MNHPGILIVEDDPDTARLLELWLCSSRYRHLGTAITGRDAIALAGSTRPDLVIMDIVLPGDLDGIQTAGILLERFDIPVLYLTAYSQEEFFERARFTSPSAYLIKPFNQRDLGRAIEVALDRHALLHQLKASEAHLAEAQAVAHIGSWHWDLLRDHVEASDELLRLFEFSPGTFEARFDTFLQRVNANDQPRALQAVEVILRGDDPGDFEVGIPLENGQQRILRVRGVAHFDAEGKAIELVGTARDVTSESLAQQEAINYRNQLEEKVAQRTAELSATNTRLQAEIASHLKTEKTLWQSEARHRSLIENLPDAVFVMQDDKVVFVNPAAVRLAGVKAPDELLGKTLADLAHPGSQTFIEQRQQAAQSSKLPNPLVSYSFVRKDGTEVEVESVSFAFEYEGRPAFLGVVHDLTERRRVERAAERFRVALDSTADAIFLIDPFAMRIMDANKTACDSLGYTREDLLELGPHEIKPHYNKATLRERFAEVLAGKPGAEMLETVHRRKDGSTFPVEISLRPFESGGCHLMVVVARDITERQLAESQLKEANERFQQFAENVSEVFWIRDLAEDRFLYVSPAFESLFKKPVSSIYQHPRSFLRAVHPEDLDRVSASFDWQREHRQGVELEYRIIVGNNETRWIWVRTFPIKDAQGHVYRLAGIAEDVTRRRESEEQYRTTVQASMDGFLVADVQGRLLDCNESFCRMLGYTREEMLRRSIPELDQCESPEKVAEHIQQVIEQGQDRFETQDLHKNGQLIDVEVSAYYQSDTSGGKLFSFVRDITQRKRADIALRESEANLERAQSIAHIGSWYFDLADQLTWSDELYRIYGVSPETFTPSVESFFNLILPDDQPAMQAWINNCASGQQAGTLEFRCVWPDGTIRYISGQGKLTLDAHGKPGHMAGTAQDITATKQAEQVRLAHEAKLRDALVREVHHRIKNNLQGVISLLRHHIVEHPDAQSSIEAAITQVNTVAVVHGLQSRIPDNELRLCELLHEVSHAASALAVESRLPAIEDALSADVWLDSNSVVTIALILNELIHNALKHGRRANGAGVEITLHGNTQRVTIHISNPGGPLPEKLDLSTGRGCGTGLDLVRTLLPRRGAELSLKESEGRITAKFVLSPPVTSTHGHVVRSSGQ